MYTLESMTFSLSPFSNVVQAYSPNTSVGFCIIILCINVCTMCPLTMHQSLTDVHKHINYLSSDAVITASVHAIYLDFTATRPRVL